MKYFLLIVMVALAVFCVRVHGQAAKPITKDNLFSAVRLGKKEKKTAARYIELIKGAKVDFVLTDKDEKTLRRDGRYLGTQGLDDLIAALRDNYRGKDNESPLPSPRFFLDVKPRELVEPYLQKNPVQADVAVAGYKGKWLKVDVEVVGIADLFGKLQLQGPDAEGTKLLLSFDRERYMAEFASFRAGQHLSVSCVFAQVLLGQVLLDNCEINKPDSPPIRTKSKPPSLS